MITKIISGGQYGVGLSALTIGKELGIKTEGYIPKDYMTNFGTRPQLSRFGIIPLDDSSYKNSVLRNISISDSTLICYTKYDKYIQSIVRLFRKHKHQFMLINMNDIISKEHLYFVDISIFLDNTNTSSVHIIGNIGKTKTEANNIYKLTNLYITEYIRTHNKNGLSE